MFEALCLEGYWIQGYFSVVATRAVRFGAPDFTEELNILQISRAI